MRHRLLPALLLVAACGRKTPPQPPQPRPPEPTSPALGASVDTPILRCGPRDSYAYVAQTFRCPDGDNPFHGDVQAAARSRSGSQLSPETNHHVDSYEVPCRSGNVTVFIDMYGCDYQKPAQRELSTTSREAIAAFDAGLDEELLTRCSQDPDDDATCLVLIPATLTALGKSADAESFVDALCGGLPVHGPKSAARALFLSYILAAISRRLESGRSAISEDDAVTTFQRMITTCGVPPDALQSISWEQFAR